MSRLRGCCCATRIAGGSDAAGRGGVSESGRDGRQRRAQSESLLQDRLRVLLVEQRWLRQLGWLRIADSKAAACRFSLSLGHCLVRAPAL